MNEMIIGGFLGVIVGIGGYIFLRLLMIQVLRNKEALAELRKICSHRNSKSINKNGKNWKCRDCGVKY